MIGCEYNDLAAGPDRVMKWWKEAMYQAAKYAEYVSRGSTQAPLHTHTYTAQKRVKSAWRLVV